MHCRSRARTQHLKLSLRDMRVLMKLDAAASADYLQAKYNTRNQGPVKQVPCPTFLFFSKFCSKVRRTNTTSIRVDDIALSKAIV